MPEEAINALRRRMIEDMTIRNFDQRTQQSYMRSVRTCCRYCDRTPAELTFEGIRRYQLHLVQCGLAPASINGAMVALRFFFRVSPWLPPVVYPVLPRILAAAHAGDALSLSEQVEL
jgi:site-specific recombinase XerD